MTAKDRKQIDDDVKAVIEAAFASEDPPPALEPMVRLLSRGLKDLNRLADVVEARMGTS